MKTALIGYTGFVGRHLQQQGSWTELYNSQNILEMKGRSFDQVLCAGISAVKWWANQNPTEDWLKIQSLLDVLQTIQTQRFILISTIDVYPHPINVHENTPLEKGAHHAYGTHRLRVENRIKNQFSDSIILRLPGLFGTGLKKNVIFDLLKQNCLDAIQPDSKFQYYSLEHLTNDIQRAIHFKIPLLNLATEPLTTSEIHHRFFPHLKIGAKAGPQGMYDFQSNYAHLWGRSDGYLYSKEQILHDLAHFIQGESL